MISWSKRSPWPSLWRPNKCSSSLPHILLLGRFRVAQLRQTPCTQSRAHEEKQKQKQKQKQQEQQYFSLTFVLQSVDWVHPDVAWGAVWATSWFSPPLAFSNNSSNGGPFCHSSKARLLTSKPSSVGQSGQLSPSPVGCC
jgi:hypothetical protein